MIKISTHDGMLFEKVGKFGEKKIKQGYKIFEALWICEWCMPSIHSLIGFGFGFAIGVIDVFSWKLIAYYPLCVGGASLCCGLIWEFYNLMVANKMYYENGQQYYYLSNKKMKDEKQQNNIKKRFVKDY